MIRCASFFAFAVLAACSASSTPTSTTTTPDAGSADAAAPAIAFGPAGAGYVVFELDATNTPTGTVGFSATFGPHLPPSTCGLPGFTPDGCCHVSGSGVASDTGTPVAQVGTISFTVDGKALATTAPFNADQPGYAIDGETVPGFTWNPGSVLRWSAPGTDAAHPLSASITQPGFPPNLAPAASPQPTISLSKDFTATWTPGTDATVKVLLSILTPNDAIYCGGLDSAGSLTIPAASLSGLTGAQAFNIIRYSPAVTATDTASILTFAMSSLNIEAKFTP